MEIEKTLAVSASPQEVWNLLLDPQVMAGAVPGMKSIDVISPTEYVAVMHQKIAFISAKFKLHTRIVEQKAPEYMRVEGTGEDASVASSLKQTSEVFLSPGAEGGTELRIKVHVDVLGRLGAFGLSVMKTKADRLWEEFGANLAARIEAGGLPAQAPASAGTAPASPAPEAVPTPAASVQVSSIQTVGEDRGGEGSAGWWARLLGRPSTARSAGSSIRVEVRQIDKTICVEWPVSAAPQCREWLESLMKQPPAR